jgi:hypothetical protein
MKTTFLIGLIAIRAGLLCAADSDAKDKLTDAARKLRDQSNYSWTTSTKEADGSPGRLSNIEGKSEKDGLTYLSFSVGGVPVEVFLKGTNGAAKALEGWMTLDEIAQTSGTAAAVVRYLRGYKTPAAQSAELIGNINTVAQEGVVLTSDLKDQAIREILLIGVRRRDGEEPPKIEGAKGAGRFWIEEGNLSKYEVQAQGKVSAGDRVTDIDRTMTVKIKDVGSTRLEVPDEARQKLLATAQGK